MSLTRRQIQAARRYGIRRQIASRFKGSRQQAAKSVVQLRKRPKAYANFLHKIRKESAWAGEMAKAGLTLELKRLK